MDGFLATFMAYISSVRIVVSALAAFHGNEPIDHDNGAFDLDGATLERKCPVQDSMSASGGQGQSTLLHYGTRNVKTLHHLPDFAAHLQWETWEAMELDKRWRQLRILLLKVASCSTLCTHAL
jgi:hypothetical protein